MDNVTLLSIVAFEELRAKHAFPKVTSLSEFCPFEGSLVHLNEDIWWGMSEVSNVDPSQGDQTNQHNRQLDDSASERHPNRPTGGESSNFVTVKN